MHAHRLPTVLARGPWLPDEVDVTWQPDAYVAPASHELAADEALRALRERGSPSHDGIAARLVGHEQRDGRLALALQPLRWALRLVEDDASRSLSVLCIARDAEGRWLAGRRAAWLSTWPERWALGAGGAVDDGEDPVAALERELFEEWSVVPQRLRVEALVDLPHHLTMLIGQAWLASGAEVTPDDEHDAYAWWPADVRDWPADADEPLRRMAEMVSDD